MYLALHWNASVFVERKTRFFCSGFLAAVYAKPAAPALSAITFKPPDSVVRLRLSVPPIFGTLIRNVDSSRRLLKSVKMFFLLFLLFLQKGSEKYSLSMCYHLDSSSKADCRKCMFLSLWSLLLLGSGTFGTTTFEYSGKLFMGGVE